MIIVMARVGKREIVAHRHAAAHCLTLGRGRAFAYGVVWNAWPPLGPLHDELALIANIAEAIRGGGGKAAKPLL